MITVRLAAADLNRLLPNEPELAIRYESGRFVIQASYARLTVTALAHPDLGDGQIRVVAPLDEVTGAPRTLLGMVWGKLRQKLEAAADERAEQCGLPLDLVWIEDLYDERHGRVMLVNLSPALLNQVLRERVPIGRLRARLAGLRVEPAAVTLRLELRDGESVERP